MEIIKTENAGTLNIHVVGRLDTRTAPALAEHLAEDNIGAFDEVILDFEELRFVSSAGIRALLVCAKQVAKRGGSIKAINVNNLCYEALDATGITDIIPTERK